MNMTADEIRKAAPELAWTERRLAISGRTREMRAENALILAGRSYEVVLETRTYGLRSMTFKAVETATNPKDCQARAVDAVASLESTFGAFSGGEGSASPDSDLISPGRVEAHISPQGYPTISVVPSVRSPGSRSRTLKAGARSDLRLLKSGDGFEVNGLLVPPLPDVAVTFNSSYSPDFEVKDSPNVCKATIKIVRTTPETDSETVAFNKLKGTWAPTIAIRQFLLADTELPAKGIDLTFDCEIERGLGRPRSCEAAGNGGASGVLVAKGEAIARAYSFDRAELDADADEIALRTTIPIHLDPKDQVMPNESGAKLIASHGGAQVAAMPSAIDLEAAYPKGALRRNQEAVVSALCQIQKDLSILCPKITTDSPYAPEFVDAVRKLTLAFRFKPELKDGSSAVGAWVIVPIKFQMAD